MLKKVARSYRAGQVNRLNKISSSLYGQGRYQESLEKATQAYTLAYQILHENHPALLTSMNNRARGYFHLGDYAQAEQLFQQVLQRQIKIFGEAHPDVIESLHNLALLYEEMGNDVQAEALLQRAQVIAVSVLGEKHPDMVFLLNALASLHIKQGDFVRSEPLLLEALAIQQEALQAMHPDTSLTLNNLGLLYEGKGDYYQSRHFYQEAWKVLYSNYGGKHPDSALVTANLAAVCQLLGDYAQAIEFNEQALQTIRTTMGEDHGSMMTIFNSLALTYQSLGDYKQAVKYASQALELSRTLEGERHINFATYLNNLGMIYNAMEDYSRAEPLLQQAMEVTIANVGKDHPALASTLNNLGVLYEMKGNHAQAEALLLQALQIRRVALGEKHPDVARSMNTLGLYYTEVQRDFVRAEGLFQEALTLRRLAFGERHPEVAYSMSCLGKLYRLKHDYIQSLSFFKQALDIRHLCLGEKHPDTGESLNNLAVLYCLLGDSSYSEQYLQQALQVWRASFGENHSAVAAGLYNLACFYAATERTDEAFMLMEQANDIETQLLGQIFSLSSEQQRIVYVEGLQRHFYSFLTLLLHSFSEAPEMLSKGLNRVLQRKGIGFEALLMQRDAVLSGRYPDLVPKLEQLAILRTQIARKMLAGSKADGLELHQRLLREWNNQKELLEEELAHVIPEMNLERQRQNTNFQSVLEALPSETALIEFVRFDTFDFQSVLTGNNSWKEAHYIAFILQAEASPTIQLVDLGVADRIEQKILSFKKALTGDGENAAPLSPFVLEEPFALSSRSAEIEPEASFDVRHLREGHRAHERTDVSLGYELRALIFDPLVAKLGTCIRLLLAPDGDLTLLPFEVLPHGQDEYLIDAYHISYVGVGRDILRFREMISTQTERPSLVIADPNFDLKVSDFSLQGKNTQSHVRQSQDLRSDAFHFSRLQGTRQEGQRIAQMLCAELWMEDDATVTKLKKAQSPHILHIATHGLFLPVQAYVKKGDSAFEMLNASSQNKLEQLFAHPPENPLLRSILALAGANTWIQGGIPPIEAEDGLLTAEDVAGIDLSDTALVVLSACETGLGHVRVGEGVFGLRRAFLLAGARTIVTSLWKVPDQQTQALMIDFYTRILQKLPYAEALREAQIALKKRGEPPLHWGAFICQGPSLLTGEIVIP